LQIEAASARYLLTDKASLFFNELEGAAAGALGDALRVPGGQAKETFWSDLMAGAVQVRHENKDKGETLWFNPMFDAGLVVDWKPGAGQWQPEAAWWVLGRDIRSSAAVEGKPGSPADLTLRDGEEVFRIASAPGWRAPARSGDADKTVRRRVVAARASLKKLQASKGGSAVYWAAIDLVTLGQPRASAEGPKVKPVLATLGTDARQRMRVVSASLSAGHEWVLTMQSPDSPSLTILITTSNVNTAPIALLDLKLLRFNRQETGHE
jgi:hypothetical protein